MRSTIIVLLLAAIVQCSAQIPDFSFTPSTFTRQSSALPKITVSCKKDTLTLASKDTVIYTLNFAPDSTPRLFSNKDYSIMASSNNISSTTVNKETETKATYTYIITPNHSGWSHIPSPAFYHKGYAYKADSVPVYVTPQKTDEEYLKEKLLQDFVSMPEKPDGTVELFINNKTGYYGVWSKGKFYPLKELNKKQIKQVNKIFR